MITRTFSSFGKINNTKNADIDQSEYSLLSTRPKHAKETAVIDQWFLYFHKRMALK